MRVLATFIVFACCSFTSHALANDNIRFAAIDVYLHTSEPVAAWQFELSDRQGTMKIVGVENGESAAYLRAPYYDREAVRLGEADRIVIADYSLAEIENLPTGRTRIATVHLLLGADDAGLEADLITATTHDGQVIDASISLDVRTGSEQ